MCERPREVYAVEGTDDVIYSAKRAKESKGRSGAGLSVSCKKREPVHAELRDEQGSDIENPEQRDQSCEALACESGNGHEDARGDENKRDGVAADDPLPVKFEIAIAGGEQCGRASDDPENGLDESGEGHRWGSVGEAEKDGDGSSNSDTAEIETANQPVSRGPFAPKSRGKLKRTQNKGHGTCRSVDDNPPPNTEVVAPVFHAVNQQKAVCVVEDEEGHAAEG
jgi:hypothetical protein